MPTPAEIAQPYYDSIINDLGRECQLIYTNGKTECPNCVFDKDTNRSSGIYKTGGSTNFTFGEVCPVCLGEGVVGSFGTDTIKLNIQAGPQKYNTSLPNYVNSAKQPILVWGFMTDLPKILKARRVLIQLDIAGYNKWEYYLCGEAFDSCQVVKGRYFSAWLERTGGS